MWSTIYEQGQISQEMFFHATHELSQWHVRAAVMVVKEKFVIGGLHTVQYLDYLRTILLLNAFDQ